MKGKFVLENGDVAPHVGAWVETHALGDESDILSVAPHVGAWVETWMDSSLGTTTMSPPTWGRGLKQSIEIPQLRGRDVAPHVGAWVETS